MGRSLAWFVVESDDAAGITTALHVKLTGRRGPHERFPLALQRLPNERSLVISTNVDEPLFKSKQLGSISRLGRTFSGSLSETVMFSAFAAWSKGRKTWSVEHQGDDDLLHLKSTGKLSREDLAVSSPSARTRRSRCSALIANKKMARKPRHFVESRLDQRTTCRPRSSI
jgi:hypothetical protein